MTYVLAALAFVVALAGAAYGGWHQRDRLAVAESERVKADAEKKIAQAHQQNAEVSQKVVIQYRDRIKVIREIPPEVAHDVQVIRNSDCKLPASWVRLHDNAAGGEADPAPIFDDISPSVDCATAIETVRENYARSRENSEQLRALQAWAEGVSK